MERKCGCCCQVISKLLQSQTLLCWCDQEITVQREAGCQGWGAGQAPAGKIVFQHIRQIARCVVKQASRSDALWQNSCRPEG